MRTVALLVLRNLRIFFRDRAAVFFSLLSALILVALYALFLGNLQVENLAEELPHATRDDIGWFVNSWVFAGIAMITTLTTALAALSVFVEDIATQRFRDFVVSPVRRIQLVFGYMIASFGVSFLMTVLVTAVTQAYQFALGYAVMTGPNWALALGYIALSSAAFAALSSFGVTFLTTTSAFSALSTIVGTVIGFLSGVYVPVGALPAGVVTVLNVLPFSHSAMLLRQPFTTSAVDQLSSGQSVAADSIRSFYGITATVGDVTITTTTAVLSLAAMTVIFAALGVWRLQRTIR